MKRDRGPARHSGLPLLLERDRRRPSPITSAGKGDDDLFAFSKHNHIDAKFAESGGGGR